MSFSIYKRLINKLLIYKSSLDNPVLIYQMGKVASSSIYNSLKLMDQLNVYHVHRMNLLHINEIRSECSKRNLAIPDDDIGIYLFNNLIKKRASAKLICLVREPISRNLSAYFQNLDAFERSRDSHDKLGTIEIIDNFILNYNHDVPLNWFDIEMKEITGIDVYKYDFPNNIGYQVIDAEPYQLLIMHHDLEDSIKQEVISEFLGIDGFILHRSNESDKKKYALKYKEVIKSINLPASYIDRLLESQYTKHFYTDADIQAIRRKWISS